MKSWIPLAVFIVSNACGKNFRNTKKINHNQVKVELLPETSRKEVLSSCFKFGYDSIGNDLSDIPIRGVTDTKRCQDLCIDDPKCFFFAVNLRNNPPENNGCWLKKDVGTPKPRADVVFGPKDCEDDELVAMIKTKMSNEDIPAGEMHVGNTKGKKEHQAFSASTGTKDVITIETNKMVPKDSSYNINKDPRYILKQLTKIVGAYKKSRETLPKGRNVENDLEFVKNTIKQFANPGKVTKFRSIELHKPGKPLREKRSPTDCVGLNCKVKATEEDFKNLELEAEKLMQQLNGEYSNVLDHLNTIDQKILQERNQQ